MLCGWRKGWVSRLKGDLLAVMISLFMMSFSSCDLVQAQDANRELGWSFHARHQEPDGNWAAAKGGGKSDASLRVTALTLLSRLSYGVDSPNEGFARDLPGAAAERQSLRRGVAWLTRQQDKKGRIALRTDPDWILDHAIATYVMTESLRLCGSVDVLPSASHAIDALSLQIDSTRPAVGLEIRLWAEMIARSLRAGLQHHRATIGDQATATATTSVDRLIRSLSSLSASDATSLREEAAEQLRASIARRDITPLSSLKWVEQPLQDPLTVWYFLVAAYIRNDPAFERLKGISVTLDRIMMREGDVRGSWDPVGPFGNTNGRFGATAMAELIMHVCYRFSRLEVCQAD